LGDPKKKNYGEKSNRDGPYRERKILSKKDYLRGAQKTFNTYKCAKKQGGERGRQSLEGRANP